MLENESVTQNDVDEYHVFLGPRFVGGGHTTFCGFLNSGVHVAMYLYYFLAALGPQVPQALLQSWPSSNSYFLYTSGFRLFVEHSFWSPFHRSCDLLFSNNILVWQTLYNRWALAHCALPFSFIIYDQMLMILFYCTVLRIWWEPIVLN